MIFQNVFVSESSSTCGTNMRFFTWMHPAVKVKCCFTLTKNQADFTLMEFFVYLVMITEGTSSGKLLITSKAFKLFLVPFKPGNTV